MADSNITLSEQDCHWLAGLLEGEGSFLTGPPSSPNMIAISIQMCDEDVIQRAAALFGTSCFGPKSRAKPHYKPCFSTRVRGLRAASIMKQLRHLMGERRRAAIDAALLSFDEKQAKRRGPGRSVVTPEQARVAKNLWLQGAGATAIAKKLGVSVANVRSIFRRKTFFDVSPNYSLLAG